MFRRPMSATGRPWPGLPPRAGVVTIVLALVSAVKFTGWYPERKERRIDGTIGVLTRRGRGFICGLMSGARKK